MGAYGNTPSVIQYLENKEKADIRLKKRDLSVLSDPELSDLVKQHFDRADIFASRSASFERSFPGRLSVILMLALPPTVMMGGTLEYSFSKGIGYTFFTGLVILGTAMWAIAKSPDDPEITSREAEIRNEALKQLYAEKYKIKREDVRVHLYLAGK